MTEEASSRRYIQASPTPVATFIDRAIGRIAEAWAGQTAMVDGYQWQPTALVENGQHVIAYMVSQLTQLGVQIIPVVGYDRWENAEYQKGIRSALRSDGKCCLRLDRSVLDDVADPEFFRENIEQIVEGLELEPAKCCVLVDLGDISMPVMPLSVLTDAAIRIVDLLRDVGFREVAIAGCSIPKTIDLAVGKRDATGMVLRKEMLLWQAMRVEFVDVKLISGDYGVRGPATIEAPSKYTNGKIRHTVKQQTFVLRGHPFVNDHDHRQMYELSARLTQSEHFQGAAFSWGDAQIERCNRRMILGGTTEWIAIDTNHHVTFVVHEVEEFERGVLIPAGAIP